MIGPVLLILVVVFVCFWIWIEVSASLYKAGSREEEIHFVETEDGWKLALHRYIARGPNPHGEPVLLHHGLGASHDSFDFGLSGGGPPMPALAPWLAEQGYEVWSCDLRGRGDSEKPSLASGKRWNWALDDYIEKDDPAFLNYILSHSAYKEVHWIGHSMGGILLLAHCARHGSPQLASGIAIGSGLHYADTGSKYDAVAKIDWLAPMLRRIPLSILGRWMAPFCGRWGLSFERFNYHPSNIAPRAARIMFADVNSDVSGRVLQQLATMFDTTGLRSMDGTILYKELSQGIKTPCLMVAGDNDLQSPVALAEKTLRDMRQGGTPDGEKHALEVFGPAFGHVTHYGHFDLVAGIHAQQEVFPRLLEWLREHPASPR